MTDRISETDLFGRFYLKKIPDEGPYKNYYRSLDAIRPLVKSRQWQDAATGYYINAPVTRDSVRLSYFTSEPEKAERTFERFLSANKDKIECAQGPERPLQAAIASLYGGEEIRFRKFLHLSTLVMLDITEADLASSRILFAAFRYDFMRSGEPCEKHFSGAFEDRSRTYRSLSERERGQFWLDMKHWPNPPQVDWIHLPVNMVLGSDINSFGKWSEYISSNFTLAEKDIDLMLEAQGLKRRMGIPEGDCHP